MSLTKIMKVVHERAKCEKRGISVFLNTALVK